ncbi:MAG: hypothetical protein HFG22_19175 [Lachnospiraceae bacterium]|nr:hypothetical protein [Lachnospiraceae bacterium]
MDSLKYVIGVVAMVLGLGLICAVIWVLLFGIPKGAMDGGTLVQDMQPVQKELGEMAEKFGGLVQEQVSHLKGGRM